ncbi:rhodanese-like domain-containing protein [Halopelagius longus]|uniref:Rhodanese-like domain-containing protein n=1 Tax=Halopelagius longus TaxID=1236180 RepID=A0A1H1DMI7_9EURY|nr:rhodanese-like domain-containing protein [Halopelagius longus]RDI71385.1 rhodanese-like domain-containing protein [Halopelagius longus]SDQ77418.1 thiosulfate sulfurtransferase [Halopelagius longus]
MVPETTPDELASKLDADGETDLTVLDIRDPSSYDEGHVAGAENVPAQRLSAETLDREWGDEVVVACYVGKSSRRVASILDSRLDADVSSLSGGFDAWDGPTESADD